LKRLEALYKEDHGGKVVYKGGEFNFEDRYCPPIILDSPNPKAKMTCEETFGPILSVYECDGVECAAKTIRSKQKPLGAYFFGDAKGEAKEYFIKHVSAGGICVNDCGFHAANPELGFGGVGYSGTGKLGG